MDAPLPPSPHGYLAGSPCALLHAIAAAELAEGRIEPACPHPADKMTLPSRTLTCIPCSAISPDGGPGECSSCGAGDGSIWSTWLDDGARVLVTARICAKCMRAGNISLAGN